MNLLRNSWGALASVLLGCCGAALAQPGGEDPSNQYYRYSNTELEAVCNAMSPTLYVSGLTDGAWMGLPGAGRTYFYRSACYMELVRRTGRAEYCPKVIARRTLWGDGSGYTPQRCQQEAAAYNTRQQQSTQDQARFALAVEGAFKISSLKVQPLPNRNWRLEVRTEGTRAGDYVLEVTQIRERKVLHRQTPALLQPSTFVWELDRTNIVGATPLPNIFPMAVRMTYLKPATATDPAAEHSTSIQNFTLSVE